MTPLSMGTSFVSVGPPNLHGEGNTSWNNAVMVDFFVGVHQQWCVLCTDTDTAAREGAPVAGDRGCVQNAPRTAGAATVAALPGRKSSVAGMGDKCSVQSRRKSAFSGS